MTLTAVKVLNNTKTVCQETCLRMTGCYAAMPSNDTTSTQCYLLLVESNSSTMMAFRPNPCKYTTVSGICQTTYKIALVICDTCIVSSNFLQESFPTTFNKTLKRGKVDLSSNNKYYLILHQALIHHL